MFEKLILSVKSLFTSHAGMMILCCLLMVGVFWGISSSQSGGHGSGALLFLLIPLIICFGMHFVMHRFMGHGGHERPREDNRQARQEEAQETLEQ